MEAPSRRMRLTVVVESLAEENAHGEYRDMALAAFKERKFAMPVQLDDTFETVWNDIEQRYKTNYLNPQQAATFSIKKLQDAYDCDLDMTDTVASIFEGETDRKMHMIRVVPHFIYRETSVVPGSMLRPTGAQKRMGDDLDDGANKRQRVASQQRQSTYQAPDPLPNQPIPSTEPHGAAASGTDHIETTRRMTRSKSGMSLVEVSHTETGQAPFNAAAVKQEPPELEQSPALHDLDAASPVAPAQTPLQQSQERLLQPADNEGQEPAAETTQDERPAVQKQTESPQFDSQEAAIQQSPISSVEPNPAPAPAAKSRKDIYQVPSSPEFMQPKVTPAKPAKTYGRSPKSGADLLNMARKIGRPAEGNITTSNGTPASSTTKQASIFQRPQADEIESTPQPEAESTARSKSHTTSNNEDDSDADLTASFLDEAAAAAATPKIAQTPARKTAAKAKAAKPGNLKTPSRTSLVSTPARTTRSARTKAPATPASAASATRSKAKSKPATSSSLSSSKGEKMRVSIGSIEDLLNASQVSNKCQGSAASTAQSGSIRSRQSSRSSPEALALAKESVPASKSNEFTDARLAAVPPRVQRTPIKSPVPVPPSTRKSVVASSTSNGVVETPESKNAEVFKKPAAKVRESPIPKPSVENVPKPTTKGTSVPVGKENATPAAKGALKTAGTPRRSEVPLPPNVRHLQRSSSSQSSPRVSGEPEASKSSPAATVKMPAKAKTTKPSPANKSNKSAANKPAARATAAKPTNGIIEISSAESSSSDPPDSDGENNEKDVEQVKPGKDTALEDQGAPIEQSTQQVPVDGNGKSNEDVELPEVLPVHEDLAMHIAETPTQEKPPSGQRASGAAPWGSQSWGFGALDAVDNANAPSQHNDEPHPGATAAAVRMASEDEGFAEQEIYSTAIEDNAPGSQSNSAAGSTRSSPAVSRRPARFLSHSPTPDTSESDDDADEVTTARAASPQINENEESDSDSDSSTDSSDDENIEMPDLPTGPNIAASAKDGPPSSPPVDSTADSIAVVPETSQPTPSQSRLPAQRTPIPPQTQQSSQAPRSSQSVSVQAADRRRYTGFRSLREQLADTRAAQATTQKKTFDPRTMNLGKLVKGKPLTGLGLDDSSDDDSSSSDSASD